MEHFIPQFLHVYFWAFIAITVGQTIYNVKLKSKGLKLKDQGFLELVIATTLFIISFWY